MAKIDYESRKALLLKSLACDGSPMVQVGRRIVNMKFIEECDKYRRNVGRCVIHHLAGPAGNLAYALETDRDLMRQANLKVADIRNAQIDVKLQAVYGVIVDALRSGRSVERVQDIVNRAIVESVSGE